MAGHRKKSGRGLGFVYRPPQLIPHEEAREIIERTGLVTVMTPNGGVNLVMNVRNYQRPIPFDLFFRILDERELGIYRAQDSDFIRIMSLKRSIKYPGLIYGTSGATHGADTQ